MTDGTSTVDADRDRVGAIEVGLNPVRCDVEVSTTDLPRVLGELVGLDDDAKPVTRIEGRDEA